jgi:hypothetical protein
MFSSVSKARIVHLRTQLNQTRKENRTGQAYFGRIKTLPDEMANAGKKLDDEVIISYIMAGLDDRYEGFVAAITALIKTENMLASSTFMPSLFHTNLVLKVGTPTMIMVVLVQTHLSMLLSVVVATEIVVAIEEAAVVATTSKVADMVEATMVVAEVVLHCTTMAVATFTLKEAMATINNSSNVKEVVAIEAEDQMLYAKICGRDGHPAF